MMAGRRAADTYHGRNSATPACRRWIRSGRAPFPEITRGRPTVPTEGCAKHLPRDRVEIVDLLHVTCYLWDAAYLFHAEGSDQASGFVRDRLLCILRAEVGYVIGGLRQIATKRKGSKGKLSAAKQKTLTKVCDYFERLRDRTRYNEYLAAGYPIASGVIEGACRHLVKDRMERAGMRWTIDGAQAVLDLRSTRINDQWPAFEAHRIHTETRRFYPQRQLLQRLEFQPAT